MSTLKGDLVVSAKNVSVVLARSCWQAFVRNYPVSVLDYFVAFVRCLFVVIVRVVSVMSV